MGELKIALAKFIKVLVKSAFIGMFFLIGGLLGTMYQQHYIETGDDFWQWQEYEKDCGVQKVDELNLIDDGNHLFYSCGERLRDYKKLRFYVMVEVGLVFLVSLLNYIIEPEDHWARKVWRGLKSTNLE